MDMFTDKQIIICTIIIVIIIGIFYVKSRVVSGGIITEPMNGAPIVKGSVNPLQQAIDGVKSLPGRFKNVRKGFDALGRGIKDELVATGNSMAFAGTDFANIMSGINYAPPFLNAAFKAEAENVKEVADISNKDLKDWFDALPTAFDPYLIDSKNHDGVFDRTVRYLKMYTGCATKYSTNFVKCLLFYMLDIIGNVFYIIFVTMPIVIIKIMTKVDVTCYYDKIFDAVQCFDDFWFGFTGFHLFHYSEGIMNMCYYCDGIPHKGPYDNIVDLPPVQPILQVPDFPKDIQNATVALRHDYDTVIPKRMGAIGQFLANNRDGIKDAGIDFDNDSKFDGYKQASNDLKTYFSDAIDKASYDFKVEIPQEFGKAQGDFSEAQQDFQDAIS